jgi:hypothetical protein
VLKGIKLAEQDLAGFLNEEITNGISQSKTLIEDGIAKLKDDIFNPQALELENPIQSIVNSTRVTYEKQESVELSIRTTEGDTVNITFEDLQQFEFNQKQLQRFSKETESDNKVVDSETFGSNPNTLAASETTKPVSDAVKRTDVNVEELEQVKSDIELIKQNTIFYQANTFSFSVNGELDKDELKAIGQLIADTNELAEEFFNGDIETAFNQALELGFDEQELSSFALQLTKVENTAVIKAYETVSRFDSDSVDSEPAKAVKPVADYLEKLLKVLDGARLHLEDTNSYENVVNKLINKLGDDVATPDLISAINRFNKFNQKLVNNLPIGYQPQNQP